MYKAIIYSVPGTGTRFCNKFMEDVLGYRQVAQGKMDTSNVYCPIHSSKINFNSKIMKMYPDARLVTPIRDPYLGYISRFSREPSFEREQETIKDWNMLIENTTRYSTVFLPINCNETDRLHYLVEVGKHLGIGAHSKFVEYANEWPVIGSRSNIEVKQEYLKHGTILGTKPTFLDFAVEWIDRLEL